MGQQDGDAEAARPDPAPGFRGLRQPYCKSDTGPQTPGIRLLITEKTPLTGFFATAPSFFCNQRQFIRSREFLYRILPLALSLLA